MKSNNLKVSLIKASWIDIIYEYIKVSKGNEIYSKYTVTVGLDIPQEWIGNSISMSIPLFPCVQYINCRDGLMNDL